MKSIIITTVAAIVLLLFAVTIAFAGDGEIISSGTFDAFTQSVNQAGVPGGNLFSIMIGLFSAWLFLIGLMCHRLEQIPGVKQKSGRSLD